jgi:hypothetical protein
MLQLLRRARRVAKMAVPGLLHVRNYIVGVSCPAYEALSGWARENESDRSREVRTDQHSVS